MKEEDWIRVEDKLPETPDEDVLVYDDNYGVVVAYYEDGYGWNSSSVYLEAVTHWMPLVLPKSNKLWANI